MYNGLTSAFLGGVMSDFCLVGGKIMKEEKVVFSLLRNDLLENK
jgi:hypothetical protein